MPELDAQYWNNRYLNDDSAWDTGAITTPLKEYFDQLNNKELFILIPGAGNAYEAEYLNEKGFKNVIVCDLAPAPLENLKKRSPSFPEKNLLLQDFFLLNRSITPNGFDLIIEQTFFCALDPSLRQKYFDKVHELLAPKGKLAGLLFDDKLNSDKPPYGGDAEEYQKYFKNKFHVKVFETAYNSIKPRVKRELFINLEK